MINAKKAVELGFADKVLFDKEEPEKKVKPEPEEGDEETGEGEDPEKKEKKLPFQKDSYTYSSKQVTDSFLSKVKDIAPSDTQIPIDQLRKRLNLLKH